MNEDILIYARQCVDNKGFGQRIKHSALLHGPRSALSGKGSAVSKGLKVASIGIRWTCGMIPIPTVGSLLADAEKAVENKLRSWHHNKKTQNSSSSEKVKFELKELSVEALDRYRWKVSEAVSELNKINHAHAEKLAKKTAENAPCDAWLELAMAHMQVQRRIEKLEQAVLGISNVLVGTLNWLSEVERGIGTTQVSPPQRVPSKSLAAVMPSSGTKAELNNFRRQFLTWVSDQKDEINNGSINPGITHGKCDKWCICRAVGKQEFWDNYRQRISDVIRELSSPFSPESFSNNTGNLWGE